MLEYVTAVAEESARFARAVTEVAELADPSEATVPSCPDWSVDDLTWHLTQVQHFWASIVEQGLAGPDEVKWPDRPASGELPARFSDVSARLVDAISGLDPDTPCWSWYEPDQRVGWVHRRQAHEALIHRVDAELARAAVGGAAPGPLDPELSADGIDELLVVMFGVDPLPPWASWHADGARVRLIASTGGEVNGAQGDRTWEVELGHRRGTDPDVADGAGERNDSGLRLVDAGSGAEVEVSATVTGPAPELNRWLWRRGPADVLHFDGDQAVAERIPALADAP